MNNIELRYHQRTDLSQISTYEELKQSLGMEINNVQIGFVRIGYLLRVAQDTNILHDSGYRNMEEFAWNEFQLKKDAVSRFININKKYSVDGYSDKLRDEYLNFGVAKLSEMLTLPDGIVEVITPEHTREQIREIKRELAEEQEITDIEVMQESMEIPSSVMAAVDLSVLDTMNKRFLYHYFKTEEGAEIFVRIFKQIVGNYDLDDETKKVMETLAPSGINTLFARVPQVGKLMMNIKGFDKPIEVLNMRDLSQKQTLAWDEMLTDLHVLMPQGHTPEETWEMIYAEDFPTQQKAEPEPVISKMAEKPVTNTLERHSEQVKKEPEKRVNTLPKAKEVAPVQKTEAKMPEKTEVKMPTNPVNKTCEPESESKEINKIEKAMEHLSYIEKCLIEARWQQALFEIRDLNDEVIKLKDAAKKNEMPGQMSIEDMEDEDGETED